MMDFEYLIVYVIKILLLSIHLLSTIRGALLDGRLILVGSYSIFEGSFPQQGVFTTSLVSFRGLSGVVGLLG